MAPAMLAALSFAAALGVKPPALARIDVDARVLNTVADNFICVTLDWWPSNKCDYGTCAWGQSSILTVDLESPRLIGALRALSPVVLRVGGSLSDLVVFESEGLKPGACKPFRLDGETSRVGFSDGCLPRARWAQLHAFARKAGALMLYVLSALHGRQRADGCCRECRRKWCNYTGRWDPSNAHALLQHTFAHANDGSGTLSVPYAFELGNELCGAKGLQAKFEAHGLAADYTRLRGMLAELWRAEGMRGPAPRLFGPACELQPDWYRAFLRSLPFPLDAVTHHAYLLGSGRMDSLREKVLDFEFLDRAQWVSMNASEVVAGALPRTRAEDAPMVWAGEAGGAYNSGQHYVTDTFLSSFWFLDELGSFSENGHHAFCRQTLVGGHYGLLNAYHRPLPDYWAALLWRTLMGARVLRVRVRGSPHLRAYAHCARAADADADGEPGALDGRLVVLALNLAKDTPASLELAVGGELLAGERELYLVTAPSLDSIQVKLNGQPLSPDARTGAMPELVPIVRQGNVPLIVPPLSYLFVMSRAPGLEAAGVCADRAPQPLLRVLDLNARLAAADREAPARVMVAAPGSAHAARAARGGAAGGDGTAAAAAAHAAAAGAQPRPAQPQPQPQPRGAEPGVVRPTGFATRANVGAAPGGGGEAAAAPRAVGGEGAPGGGGGGGGAPGAAPGVDGAARPSQAGGEGGAIVGEGGAAAATGEEEPWSVVKLWPLACVLPPLLALRSTRVRLWLRGWLFNPLLARRTRSHPR